MLTFEIEASETAEINESRARQDAQCAAVQTASEEVVPTMARYNDQDFLVYSRRQADAELPIDCDC